MTDSNTRKAASNTVLLILGSEIVGRFDPLQRTNEETGKTVTTPALTQATAFCLSVLEDEEHELYEAMNEGKIESVNAKVATVGFQQVRKFTMG